MKFSFAIFLGLFALTWSAPTSSAQSAQTSPNTAGAQSKQASARPVSSLPDWNGIWVLDFPKRGDPPRRGAIVDANGRRGAKGSEGRRSEKPRASHRKRELLAARHAHHHVSALRREFLFTPGRVTIIQEAYMQVRRVFTDGRGHPADLDPTFNGHSIGHWEGDTLVIDTAGLGTKRRWGTTASTTVRTCIRSSASIALAR